MLLYLTLQIPRQSAVARRAFSSNEEDDEVLELRNTKTHANLVEAFKGESMVLICVRMQLIIQANRRYLYFAQKADVEGQSEIAAIFRSTAEGISYSLITF